MIDVHRTAAQVAELCRSFGCDEVGESVDRTGLVAVDRDARPMMDAEDFSFLLNERSGANIFLDKGDTAMPHHSAYRFDDRASTFGASWFARLAEMRLPAGLTYSGCSPCGAGLRWVVF